MVSPLSISMLLLLLALVFIIVLALAFVVFGSVTSLESDRLDADPVFFVDPNTRRQDSAAYDMGRLCYKPRSPPQKNVFIAVFFLEFNRVDTVVPSMFFSRYESRSDDFFDDV